jgi:hypothetical protein
MQDAVVHSSQTFLWLFGNLYSIKYKEEANIIRIQLEVDGVGSRTTNLLACCMKESSTSGGR